MTLKARDIEGIFKAHGSERGALMCMQQLAEEQGAVREAVAQLAEMMNSMADTLIDITKVAHKQHDFVKDVQKRMGIGDGHDDGRQTRDG